MRKLLVMTVAAVALVIPATSSAGDDYNPNPNASACGQYHGAFGAFGKGNNFAGGANGEATGDANSAKGCQNNYPTAP